MKRVSFLLPLALLAAMELTDIASARPAAPGLAPASLRCESHADPIGIDDAHPRLGWILTPSRPADRDQRQTAYQVQVARSMERLASGKPDLWDSGKVVSGDSVQVAYGGRLLTAGEAAYWRVRVWDRDGVPSAYSAAVRWERGPATPADWGAEWIRRPRAGALTDEERLRDDPAPLLRREFKTHGKIVRARAYVSGLGYYELRVNGRKVGDHLLDPGWTNYSRRVPYSTYDVTSLLREGPNAVGLMLGSGWYNPVPIRLFGRFNLREQLTVGEPRGILRLEIRYADGTREAVVTDGAWRCAVGPIMRNSVYLGEQYDARRERTGWDLPGYDDSTWEPVEPAQEPLRPLRAQLQPPIRETATLHPTAVTEPRPGVYIIDMGRNFAGVITLRVRGEAGKRITLRYGELLYPNGELNPMTSVTGQVKRQRVPPGSEYPSTAVQTDSYTLRGGGEESFTPRFTFHGFRYVEVTGFPGRPELSSLTGHRLNSDVRPVGEFACSNPLFNRIHETVRWTLLSNLFSVQSDCPHREKLGYGGDIVATSEMALLNLDMAQFYAKVVRDFGDDQRPNGGMTETAPFVGIADEGLGEGAGPVGWGTAHPLLLWQLYRHYGDLRLLREQYPAAQRWVALLDQRARDGILVNGISDHESLAPKPQALTGTAFYFENLRLLSRLARILGRESEAKEYDLRAERVREAFNRKFLHENGIYDSGTQACQSFPLFYGLAPEPQRGAVLNALVADVDRHDGHLTTGIFGTRTLLMGLTYLGRADVAYRIANQRSFPGWGHMLERGATTLWEHWEFSDNTFSHNHPMFGSVDEWFISGLAGIRVDDDAVGADRITIRPSFPLDLTWVRASHRSVRGLIVSEWRRTPEALRIHVRVPTGTRATLHLPTASPSRVTESGVGLNAPGARPGIDQLRSGGGATTCRLACGDYRFEVRGAITGEK